MAQRMPYNLNPLEEQTLQALAAGLGAGMDPMQAYGIYGQTMGGAIDRRQSNLAARREGLQGLQQVAMQLAASGADPEAVTTAVTGQAAALPLMKNPRGAQRLLGLQDYVSGLYDEGSDISGLAPPDVQEAYGGTTMGLDDEDKAAIGQIVVGQLGKPGVTQTDIFDNVRMQLAGLGYDPDQITEGVMFAQQTMEQAMPDVYTPELLGASGSVNLGDPGAGSSGFLGDFLKSLRLPTDITQTLYGMR